MTLKTPINTYADVIKLLSDFDAQRTPPVDIEVSPHGDFWSALSEQQFLTGNVPGATDDAGNPIRICIPGNGADSPLVQALRGTPGSIFDPETGSIGRMPADGGPFMDDACIQAIADWISAQPPEVTDAPPTRA
jgi:hypothetical protein